MATHLELTDALRDEYALLFAQAAIRPEHAFAVAAMVARIVEAATWSRYKAVEAATGVPAFVTGIIHSLEANLCFKSHLHNGDPLTARTVHVPAGRPALGEPPFDWETSAADALCLHKLDRWADWTLPGIAFVLERYNGWGYRRYHPQVKSPYLWSFTTIYTAGKYGSDGIWSDGIISGQCGGMALLAHMVATGLVDLPGPEALDTVALTAEDRQEAAIRPPASQPAYPGHFLKEGDRDAAIVAVRRRLAECGIRDVAKDDDRFDEALTAAVRQFQARSQDEAGRPLVVDGLVGQRTWKALFGTDAAPGARPAAATPGGLAEAVLRVAAGELGVREEPPGSNSGPRVNQYLASLGLAPGNSWCAAFLYWCFGEAAKGLGLANPLPGVGYVLDLWGKARTDGRVIPAAEAAKDPRLVTPGMVFCMDCGQKRGHAGLVADLADGRLVTIEGNTSKGVARLTCRAIADINLGFITPA